MRETLEIFHRLNVEEINILGRSWQLDSWVDEGYSVTSQIFQMHPHFYHSLTVGRNLPRDTEIEGVFWQPLKNHMF